MCSSDLLRFRPIVMTSLAFILGVLPLAIATGASSKSQQAIGTGVMGGMISATLLAVFFVPVFFWVVIRLTDRSARQEPYPEKPAAADPGEAGEGAAPEGAH